MFAVLYRFITLPGEQESFEMAWKALTGLIYEHQGSMGSRLHRLSVKEYIAYAQWPDRESWEASRTGLLPEADTYRAIMRASCKAIDIQMELDVVSDMLERLPYPKRG